MRDKVFVDSNLIIYSYSKNDKYREIMENIFTDNYIILSTQVLNEVSNVLKRKMNVDIDNIIVAIEELREKFNIVNIVFKTIVNALLISKKYGYSYYDSLIISSALENGCKILFSEDMQDGQLIEKSLRIKNPFN